MEVVVNAAMSADGKLADRTREQLAISGPADFDRVDQLRAESDAVMVGVGTVLADDPSLTLDAEDRIDTRRGRGDTPHPARVVVDSRLRTPVDARLLSDVATTYLLTTDDAPTEQESRLEEAGATVERVGSGERVPIRAGLDILGDHGIDQVMVEGGGELIFSLFEAGCVDRLSIYVGSLVIGGRDAPTLVDGRGFVGDYPELTLETIERIDNGVRLEYIVTSTDPSSEL